MRLPTHRPLIPVDELLVEESLTPMGLARVEVAGRLSHPRALGRGCRRDCEPVSARVRR